MLPSAASLGSKYLFQVLFAEDPEDLISSTSLGGFGLLACRSDSERNSLPSARNYSTINTDIDYHHDDALSRCAKQIIRPLPDAID